MIERLRTARVRVAETHIAGGRYSGAAFAGEVAVIGLFFLNSAIDSSDTYGKVGVIRHGRIAPTKLRRRSMGLS
jgi:hypothetical protein